MSKRSKSIASIFATRPEEPELSADNPSRVSRVSAGSVRSMKESFSHIERENEELRQSLADGARIVEVDPALIDPSPFADRFPDDEDSSSFEALKNSIEERGQEVPVLLRVHPKDASRYQTAFGHRRVRALGVLRRPVRALVRELDDEALAVAQGLENSARQDLTFIEQAVFAKRLEDRGQSRLVIQHALTVDNEGKVLEGAADGNLCITDSWPGQMRTVYGDHERFIQTYFSTYKGKYFTGDGCRRDEDGYYWITGRVDDVLNVSGHRLGTAEVESALVSHSLVSEAAVVGYPHNIKGQGIYCYVTLMAGNEGSDELRQQLVKHVRSEIGPIAAPDKIQFASGLPKTRSGKIMRRILRKIAEDDFGALGDISTLADPAVVDDLIANRQNKAEG